MCRALSIAKEASLIKTCLEPMLLPAPVNHFTAMITPFELGVQSVAAQHTPPDDPA